MTILANGLSVPFEVRCWMQAMPLAGTKLPVVSSTGMYALVWPGRLPTWTCVQACMSSAVA